MCAQFQLTVTVAFPLKYFWSGSLWARTKLLQNWILFFVRIFCQFMVYLFMSIVCSISAWYISPAKISIRPVMNPDEAAPKLGSPARRWQSGARGKAARETSSRSMLTIRRQGGNQECYLIPPGDCHPTQSNPSTHSTTVLHPSETAFFLHLYLKVLPWSQTLIDFWKQHQH